MSDRRAVPILSRVMIVLVIIIVVMAEDATGASFRDTLPSESEPRYVSISTNIVPWGAGVMNVAVEAQVGTRMSVQLPVMWCPWWIGRRHAVRTFAAQPEGRWWLDTPGKGHFAGAHLSIAWFNLRYGDDRYQDHGRPLLGAGISYGYRLPLGKSWGMEFSLGVGYASMRYDRFYNIPNGSLIDLRTTGYFGIDRIGVSLYYNIDLNKIKNVSW